MSAVKLKICGMKYNLEEVAKLQPDYLGFIFYDKSPRNFDGEITNIGKDISRVGVFVNSEIEKILKNIKIFKLNVIQLHGEESPSYCEELSEVLSTNIEIWKVFSIKDSFDFTRLKSYEHIVDKFLFDTKGKAKGGNGYTFDWKLLTEYNSEKPFILSGGIGPEELHEVKKILKTKLPIHAIDVNSKFEISPGLKNTTDLKNFIDEL
jgi:phosphoribosylanthranilate isomerase